VKVAICIPCHGSPRFKFTISLGGLLLDTTYAGLPDPIRFDLLGLESSNLPYARNHLAKEALARNPDYLLWLDADHMFPSDSLFRLLGHGKDVVGINQPRRYPPHGPTAQGLDGQPIQSKPGQTGLQEVAHPGLGMCLVKASALKDLKWPLFAGGEEDVFFFKQLRNAGVKVFVDHALSREVAHIAETELRFP
jgi:glycosyltransferase involved in cell wall biosynthesis